MTRVIMGVKDKQLNCICFIKYQVKFKGDTKMQAFIDFYSKINAITSAYPAVLEIRICFTAVKAQKIDSFMFSTHIMVLANFQYKDKQKKTRFF